MLVELDSQTLSSHTVVCILILGPATQKQFHLYLYPEFISTILKTGVRKPCSSGTFNWQMATWSAAGYHARES